MKNTNTSQEEIQYFKDKTKQILQENNFAKISTRIKLRRMGIIMLASFFLWILLYPIEIKFAFLGSAITILFFTSSVIISLFTPGMGEISLFTQGVGEEINVAQKEMLEKFKLNKQELAMFYKILNSFELLDKDCKARIIYYEIAEGGISFKNIEPIIQALKDKTEEIKKEEAKSIKEKQKIIIVQNILNGSKFE